MKAYRTYLTVTDAKQIVVDDLPFEPGQRVEVLVLADGEDREAAILRLERVLQDTQALGETNGITDPVISEEIEAYRSGR
ncbi:MAG: hypothetical protein U0768_15815 [Anaerolineae bacterium]